MGVNRNPRPFVVRVHCTPLLGRRQRKRPAGGLPVPVELGAVEWSEEVERYDDATAGARLSP